MPQVRVGHGDAEQDPFGDHCGGGEQHERVTSDTFVAEPELVEAGLLGGPGRVDDGRRRRVREQPHSGAHGARQSAHLCPVILGRSFSDGHLGTAPLACASGISLNSPSPLATRLM